MAEQKHDRILGYFLEEADEHLKTMEQGLRRLAETVKQPETIRELFRGAHSIKGSAAMLGLKDVQQVGNQFEANFKLLKEHPTIAVDPRLQSLFLQSFELLRAAIAETKTATDPYNRDPASPDSVSDPVFEELKSYLQYLLTQSSVSRENLAPTTAIDREQNFTQDPAVKQVFGDYVTRKLGEIASLCQQSDRLEIRAQIQQICQKLGHLGENFDFLEWTNLFTACRLAIANPQNTLSQLGDTISIAIKQSQDLVLADRPQVITITPALEALINHQHQSNSSIDKDISRSKLDNFSDPFGGIGMGNSLDYSKLELDHVPDLSPIYDRDLSFNFDTSDNLANLSAVPEAEIDAGKMELNEFMNLLSDDIPANGTWMQDDDFSGNEFPQYQPINDSALIEDTNAVNYEEETIYTPEADDINDLDLPNFWPDLQATSAHQPLYDEFDRSENARDRLQPDRPIAQPLDLPTPDFTLDCPISDLFPPASTTEDWAEIPHLEQTSSDILSFESIPNHAIDDSISWEINPATELESTNSLPSNHFHPDLQIEMKTPDLYIDNIEIIPLSHDDFGLAPNGMLEDVSFGTDILATGDTTTDIFDLNLPDSSQVSSSDEAPDWNDLSADFNLDALNSNEPVESIAGDRDFADFNLDALNSNEPVESIAGDRDFADFNLDALNSNKPVESIAGDRDFADFNLDALNSNEPVESIAGDRDFADFNLDALNSNEPVESIAGDRDFADFNLDALNSNEPVESIAGDRDFADFNLDALNSNEPVESIAGDRDFADFNLDALNSNEPVESIAGDRDFADFNLDALNSNKPVESIAGDRDFANFNLEELNSNEPIESVSIDRDFADFNLDALNSNKPVESIAGDRDFANFDLAALNSNEPVESVSGDRDFADFNLEELNSNEPVESMAGDRDFADFNLDTLNSNKPVESMAGDRNFADFNLDALNSTEPVGDILTGLDFANFDLDALNSTEPVGDISTGLDFANFDLDALNSNEPVGDISTGLDFANFDLDALNSNEPVGDISTGLDFANFDLDALNSNEPVGDISTGLDFANFDLDALNSNEPVGDISTGLDFANFDLDALNSNELVGMEGLDALLLGAASLGVGGAILTGGGSTFDELDALMGNPSSTDNLNDLDLLLTTSAPVVQAPVAKTPDRRSKQRSFEQTMRVSVGHLNNLNNLVGELVVNRNTLEQDQNRMRQFIEKLLSEVQKLNEVGKRMQDLYERSLMENSLVASRQQSKATSTPSPAISENLDRESTLMEYDPLEMDRFTPLHLLSQKMIELTVRIRESTADIEFVVDGSTEVTRTLRQITGQLQEDLTKSRMIPFAQTADRLQRGVRDNGLKYGKEVELSVEGRDTLIDKVILESLTDPLIHMVNNAIAHGIETPEMRQSVGKPKEGKITVRAIHQGNQTIISISDDGAGINTEIVKMKAMEKGIITAKQAATMSKTEAYELLFLPSFSTKDKADELAGRGVGMDVVRTSLNEIRGTITTESYLGLGTTFTIRLPLALSIAKALIAVNNKNSIAFPMDGIEDTQDVGPEQIQINSQGEPCIFWRDNLMPFKPLSDLLGFNRPLSRNNFYGTQEDDSDLVSILILRSDGNLIAVQVDKIIGDQEIVIKPLQGPSSKPLGIAGATVLGDGRIIPIADVMELIALAKGTLTRHISTNWTNQMSAPTIEHRESMVLIVDDSITVRELLSLTFKRAGYRVEQARDGQEAWDKLRAGLPCDIVFCDIEMPRMDGLEFLSRVQKDVALSKVPVAMLTSRGSDRHRQIAAQLGASGYFIKPYLEEALLDAAKRMIKGEILAIV